MPATLASKSGQDSCHRPVKLIVTKHVSYQGDRFEVPYELSAQRVVLVVDPHTGQVHGVEDEEGQSLGAATPLDAVANVNRRRHKPEPAEPAARSTPTELDAVELAYRAYYGDGEEEQR